MDSNMKRDIILEHYQHPYHKGFVSDSSYKKSNVNNESCIDNIDIMMKVENNMIKDIRFDGEACAISTSATSIMIKHLIGKSIDETKHFLDEYENMINEKQYDSSILGEAIVYDEIYKQPNRKKCALLPLVGIRKILANDIRGC